MNRILITILFLLSTFVLISLCLGCPKGGQGVEIKETLSSSPSPSNHESLVMMLEKMRRNGLNTDDELLWGYYFIDPDSSKLRDAVPHFKT